MKRITSFKDHQIISETPHEIVFRRPDCGQYAVRFAHAGPALFMVGGLCTACWAYTSPASTLRGKIAWIGLGGSDYAAEKWQIGMGVDPYQWDAEQAISDLTRDLSEREDDGLPTIEAVAEAIRAARSADREGFIDALCGGGWEGEDAVGLGRAYKPRVLWSHAAARACAQLLAAIERSPAGEEASP